MSTKIHNSAKEERYDLVCNRERGRERERKKREKERDRMGVAEVATITGKNIPEKMGLDVTVFVHSIRHLVTLYLRQFQTFQKLN